MLEIATGMCRREFERLTLFFVLLLVQILPAYAQDARIPDSTIAAAVVQLSSTESPGCATGFLSDSKHLVTNFHVYNSLCPTGTCEYLQVKRARMADSVASEELTLPGLRLLATFPALDIVVFEHDGSPGLRSPFHFDPQAAASAGDTIFSAGFPGCNLLYISQGTFREYEGFLLHSTLSGKHGSSGSPVFTINGALLGVVEEAESLLESSASMLFSRYFQLKAVRYAIIDQLLASPPDNYIKIQADQILSHFLQHILPMEEGPARFIKGMQLQSRLEGLEESILLSEVDYQEELQAISSRNRYLGEILRVSPKSWQSALAEQIELIVIGSTIEVNGLREGFLQPLSRSSVQKAFERNERSELFVRILEEILASHSGKRANGSLYSAFAVVSQAILIGVAVLSLWLVSLGYVFGSYRGTFVGKLFVTLFVQILLWPLSFVVFMLFRKK